MKTAHRTVFLVVLAFSVMMVAVSSASAGTVTIKAPRGAADISVDLATISQHFDVDAVYEIRSGSGSARTERIQGISLDKLFGVVGADPTYRGVSVLRPDGGSVFISKGQITAGSPSPVVYESGGEVRFLRPSYSEKDDNAGDIVSSSGNLILQQTADATLKLTVKASKKKANARELVKFSATVSGVGAGEAYKVTWVFDDGKKGTGEAVSHRFSKRGVYRVLATVNTGSATQSAVVSVQIGDPVKSKEDRTGGGTNDSGSAPDSGASDGRSGSGDSATTDDSKPAKPVPRSEANPDTSPSEALPTITGQVIDPSATTTLDQQSDLAARTGSQTEDPTEDQASAGGVPDQAVGIAGALGLLGLGFLLEIGAFGGFRSRLGIG